MKRYLIMGSYFEEDMLNLTDYILNNIDGKGKISVFSPVMMPSIGGKGKKDFFLSLLAIASALGEENLPFTFEEDIQIVIGNATKAVKFDEILVVDWNTLSTQESYYENHLKQKIKTKIDLYRADDADDYFNSVGEVLSYILGG